MRGLDGTADNWGVIANRDIQNGEVITIFGGTTYLIGSERLGADFGLLHARLHDAGEPLQYTLQGIWQSQAGPRFGQSQSQTKKQ